MAYQQGALAQSEKEIILQIISLDRRTAKEVMKPRSRMAAISDDLSIEEMIAAARNYKHRRLPIYDETPDTIVGILNTRALLLDPQIDLADAIEFPSFVPETMNLLQLLKSLQRQQRGLAIVLDEFGGTAGIVTMEDILEEVIGKIQGQAEAEGFVMEKLGPGRWRVAGTLRLDDFRREYPALGDVPEVETMGGLLMSLLDVVPARGESATFCGLKLSAQVARRAPRAGVARGGGEVNLLIWAVFIACLALSFVLSGMEAGVFALSRLRIRQQMRAGQASAKVLHDYLENPENFLWTILVGNTVANFLILGWLVVQLHQALGGYRVWFVVVFSVAVFLFYAFFDLLPKMLFRMHPNRLCVVLARPFRFIHLALRPLVALVETFSGAAAAVAGRQSLHRAPVRQPRGAAAGDAGVRAGVHLGRADDDQPRARLADADGAPGHEAAGAGRGHDRADARQRRAGAVPGTPAHPPAGVGEPRRPAADRRAARLEHAALPAGPGHQQAGRANT